MTNLALRKSHPGYWLRLLIFGALWGLIFGYLALQFAYSYILVRPIKQTICCQSPADFGSPYEDMTFTGPDGAALSGWYLPSQNRAAVILLHGYGADRREMLRQAEMLAGGGFGVLLYDLRAHGESQGNQRTFGWQDTGDVYRALGYLLARPEVDPHRIGLLGSSIGGQVAIRAAAEYPEISAVVGDDPGYVTIWDAPPPANASETGMYATIWLDTQFIRLLTWSTPPMGVAREIAKISPRPLMLIATGNGPGKRLVFHYYDLAGEPKSIWHIPEATHGQQVSLRPQEYEERILQFFTTALLR